MRRALMFTAGTTLLATGLLLSPVSGSSPSSSTLTVPSSAGSASASWTGTIPTGSDPTSDCSTLAGGLADAHTVKVVPPSDGYTKVNATFDFSITWTPATVEDVADEVLELQAPDGSTIASSDGSDTTEKVTVRNLAAGTYTLLACGYVNVASQDYTGTAKVTTVAKTATATSGGTTTSHTVNDTLMSFTPATVVDPILFGGEPGVNFDPTVSDGSRMFVDWPVSSRQNIGVLYRSTDGGATFGKRYADVTDAASAGPACLGRQIPYCPAGGGGDTDVNIDPSNGTLYMSSQESLANQSVGVSFDHGTTFPADHADALVDKGATDVDRQWLANFGNGKDVFLAYHSPLIGEYVNHSSTAGSTGSWGINPVPTIPGVTQSGALLADNRVADKHILYLAYVADGINSAANGGSQPALLSGGTALDGFAVAVSTDAGQTFVNYKIPGGDNARNFVKIQHDTAGNLYAVWTDSTNQQTFLAVSPYNATTPGKTWKGPYKVSGSPLNVTIFPDVVAGDPGRISVIYYGTAASAATPDDVKPNTGGWWPYVATSLDATCVLSSSSPCSSPTFHQQRVATKVNQNDNICTSGTACAATGGNRNLLDYWDISLDRQGHLGFVWGDGTNQTLLPFVKVARQASGPSLYAGKPNAKLSLRGNGYPDAAGDARFPISGANINSASNHATLDLRGTSVAVSGSNLEFKVRLASTSDLGAGVPTGNDGLTPLQQAKYLIRWDYGNNAYYAGANVASGSGSTPTFFSGVVDNTEGLMAAGATAPYGNTYAPQGTATGSVSNGVLTIKVPLSQVGSPRVGSRFVSVGSYTLVGPIDALATLNTAPITVDSSPTFDTTLRAAATSSGGASGGSGGSGGSGSGSGGSGGGSLAKTGGSAALSLAGLLLIGSALVVRRRRAS